MVSAPAAQAQFKAGEYVRSGYGVLTVGAADRGATKFQISVVGSNFHTCELEGVIRNLEARMEESADDKLPCVVTFKPEKNGITVDAKNDRACSAYCGMRASFTGSYAIPRAGCAPSQVRQTRARFNAAYAKKQFADARVLLTPVHANCAPYLDIYGQAWVGNDLALTQYRTGDSAACGLPAASSSTRFLRLAPALKCLPADASTMLCTASSRSSASNTVASWPIKSISRKLFGGRRSSTVATWFSMVKPTSSLLIGGSRYVKFCAVLATFTRMIS